MDDIVIVGSSGHAKVVIDAIEQTGRYRIAGLIDRFRPVGEQTLGYAVLGGEDDLPALSKRHALKGALVAIGDNFVRAEVVARVGTLCPQLRFVNAVHPGACLGKDVAVGEGTVILAGVTVNASCDIGRHCILNTQSSLDHDSLMHDFASLAPGVLTGGRCQIGSHAAIGIGAILAHGIHVGMHAVVGAGSVVLHHVDPWVVAYGSPARAVRLRVAGAKYL